MVSAMIQKYKPGLNLEICQVLIQEDDQAAAWRLPSGLDLFSTGLVRTGFGSDRNIKGFR